MGEIPARSQPSHPRVPIGRIFALLVTLALLGAAGAVTHHELSYRQRARVLDDDLAALRRLHWERPVLRGAAGNGNAAAEASAALGGFAPLRGTLRAALAEKLYYGQPPNEAEERALADRQRPLRALRAATQQGWAFTELAVERGPEMRVPDYPRLVDAGLCLLIDARQAPPAECLRVAADVIRLGQDLVPGAPLEAASVSAKLTGLASRLVPRCAQSADLATLRRAVHELNLLATHPPPTGTGIEVQELSAAMQLRTALALTNKHSAAGVAQALVARPKLLAAWALFDNPSRFRKRTPAQYPDATDEWKRERDYRTRLVLPRVTEADDSVLERLHDDMRGQAVLRMLVIGMATLAERAYRGKLPAVPSSLEDPALVDPYRGAPFSFRMAPGASELTLWSVGEDLKDDGGSSDWTDSGPTDVVVHFTLPRTEVKKP